MIGYHFTCDTLRDGRPVPPIGEWLEHDGPVSPCESGLHASEHPFDALRYAPGNWLHRVELEGDLRPHGTPVDKWVGRRRRILATIDATALLREFARWCAMQVIDLWDAPDVVRRYLETGDDSLRAAAWAAARDAAGASTRAAAWAAAWAAADAAEAAGVAGVATAARAARAAWAAARAATAARAADAAEAAEAAGVAGVATAAWAAARAATAARPAAAAAAWADAAAAAENAQRDRLAEMVDAAFAA